MGFSIQEAVFRSQDGTLHAMPFDPHQLITLQAIAFDVDGVLTDGSFAWSATGEESKSFSFADVMGVSLLRRLGIKMALISGEHSPLVDRYAEKLHIPFVAKGTRDKATAIRDFTTQFSISLEDTCFFGDDVNDLPAMDIAGLCACPSNAAGEVLAHVAEHGFISPLPGGQGAVRSFADAILAARKLRGSDVFQLRPPE
jgi:3-deoxy-D-manno-octulosonate 8-phosphate phosphatase (KDO 8-P phosphatase)